MSREVGALCLLEEVFINQWVGGGRLHLVWGEMFFEDDGGHVAVEDHFGQHVEGGVGEP